jgi:hypothetical protein
MNVSGDSWRAIDRRMIDIKTSTSRRSGTFLHDGGSLKPRPARSDSLDISTMVRMCRI